jgi:SAM-dependent methyltransferase
MSSPSIEDVQSYWDSRPCNARHSRVDIDLDPLRYSREVTGRKHFVEPHIPSFAEFDKWKDKWVLELGCGIGTAAMEFARNGAKYVGVDISPRSIEIAQKRYEAERAVSGFSLVLLIADIEDLYPPHHPFDLVYSFGVIHHTPHPEKAIHTAYKYLRPGGEFRLMLYNRWSWKAFWILAKFGKFQFWRWPELIALHSEAQTGCPITHTYTRKSARFLLENGGFNLESIEVNHIFPYRIPDYIQYRYIKEWYWERMPKSLFNWLECHFGWHMLIKARRKEK